ncbi:AMP-binding enzyme [Propioniciclava coleopterorum]|uniref:AMP-binding enzyme n=1 Tax=Propioniciclava coleopterorum TaxID=2714937 RepID=UPI0032B85694
MYRTGDLARLTADREIEYLGRADAEVKVRGHRVDLGEIETSIQENPAVQAAVVNLIDKEINGGRLAAFILLARPVDDVDALRMDLHEHMRAKLPPYMVPDFIDTIDTIPLMPSGKADRKALPRPATDPLVSSGGEFVAPEGEIEEYLNGVWADVLGLPAETISVAADLFDDLGATRWSPPRWCRPCAAPASSAQRRCRCPRCTSTPRSAVSRPISRSRRRRTGCRGCRGTRSSRRAPPPPPGGACGVSGSRSWAGSSPPSWSRCSRSGSSTPPTAASRTTPCCCRWA